MSCIPLIMTIVYVAIGAGYESILPVRDYIHWDFPTMILEASFYNIIFLGDYSCSGAVYW